MRIVCAKDYTDMSRKAANVISAQVIIKPNAVLGLATGATPLGTYRKLIDWYRKGDIDFGQVKTANLDEYRGLSEKNKQSYHYFMQENFFSHINIKSKNTHLPNGMEMDAATECARYDAVVHFLGGVDLQLLGIGHNGHIGFNEPADHFAKGTHCVDLSERTMEANKRFFGDTEHVPSQAYTMGIQTIMYAHKLLVIVSGEDKAEIVNKAFFGPVTPWIPASILQMHPDVTIIADAAALSKCEKGAFECDHTERKGF